MRIFISFTKDENDKKFKLAASQISKRKIASQRYYKEEHELILRNVKKNIENKFDVEISEGYFFYIFSSQKLDTNSIEFVMNIILNILYFLLIKWNLIIIFILI